MTTAKLVTALCIFTLKVNSSLAAGPITGSVGGLVAPDSRPCAFFSLIGISEAEHDVKPGWPWFAVRQSQNGFKEIYALLLSAKLSGIPVIVNTTSAAVAECDGYVGVSNIFFYSP